MDKLSKIQKRVLCYLGLIIVFVLMGNSNNVPEIFAERIFKPITGNDWSIHYSGLIIILGIYYCLKNLNEIREISLIRTRFRRFVVTIILMSIFSGIWVYCIQFYKGFYKNLNSIYIEREKVLVSFYINEGKVTVNGKIDIINCSSDIQKFHVKIKIPSLVKEYIKEEYITLENEFKVNSKEEKIISINEEFIFDKDVQYSAYDIKAFEYILFNDEDEVVFKGTSEEYQMDEWDLQSNFLNIE